MKKEISRQIEIIKSRAVDIISEQDLVVKLSACLEKKRPLKIKIGFDPTASDIHLGHTVLLRPLRKLQDLGHRVYFIIGDFTAKIGDPSGRATLRPVLTDRQIKSNAATYTRQAFKILDKQKTKIIYNSVWYKNMNLSRFLSLLSSYTVARMLERDDFSKRMKENKPLTMLEIIYPLIQGYDSYKLGADVEFGGTDQKFNLIVGRHLQQFFGQPAQAVVTMPLLVGLDGVNKMSKSLGNYVGVTDSAKDMFGKLMSVSDEIMWEYFRLLTDCNLEEMKSLHPKEAKARMARELVSFYHSPKAATRETAEFERVFSKKEIPADIPVYKAAAEQVDLARILQERGIVSSKNEARRLLSQGSISSEGKAIKNQVINVPAEGIIIKVGKKRFLKIER